MKLLDINKLFTSLNGLFAYDTGSINSGIYDEFLRTEIIEYLDSLEEDEFRILLSTFVREKFLSEKALQSGYGIEDVYSFIKWLDKYMSIEL